MIVEVEGPETVDGDDELLGEHHRVAPSQAVLGREPEGRREHLAERSVHHRRQWRLHPRHRIVVDVQPQDLVVEGDVRQRKRRHPQAHQLAGALEAREHGAAHVALRALALVEHVGHDLLVGDGRVGAPTHEVVHVAVARGHEGQRGRASAGALSAVLVCAPDRRGRDEARQIRKSRQCGFVRQLGGHDHSSWIDGLGLLGPLRLGASAAQKSQQQRSARHELREYAGDRFESTRRLLNHRSIIGDKR